jgi:sterol 3beta-glucosyltransferase
MRAVFTNFGTMGDILPLIALAYVFRRRGHEVVMAFAPSHRHIVAAHGFQFAPVGPDLGDVQHAINLRWITDESTYASTDAMTCLLAPLASALPETYDDLRRATRQADVLVSGPAQPAARMVHETTAIPFASVQFSNFGGSGTPGLQAATAAAINPFRKALGLTPLANPTTVDANSPQLALYAMSRHLMPRPARWPAHYRIVGFFFLAAQEWVPDDALMRFMDADVPPVIVSFGSMPQVEPRRVDDVIREAASIAGVRIVLQRNDGVGGTAGQSERVHVTGFVPHSWLFARGSCVVHHGGAGTAAAVFRSGRPSVYVPHGRIFDQHYWAQLSRDVRCSGDPIPIEELTAPRLAHAIRDALDVPERRAAARGLGELVAGEDGTAGARAAIEGLVTRVGLGEGPAGIGPKELST